MRGRGGQKPEDQPRGPTSSEGRREARPQTSRSDVPCGQHEGDRRPRERGRHREDTRTTLPRPRPADGERGRPGGRGTRTVQRGEKTRRGRSWPRSWARRVLKSKCLRLRPCPAHTSDPGKGRSGRLGSGEPRTLHTGAPGIRAGARPAKTSPYTDRQVRGPRGPGGGLAVSDAVRVAAALR